MSEKIIDFPATGNEKEQESMKELIEKLAECLGTTIKVQKVALLRVVYDGMRLDVERILSELSKKPGQRTTRRARKSKSDTKPFRLSEQKMEDVDPLGS
jgi:hypothetical protein